MSWEYDRTDEILAPFREQTDRVLTIHDHGFLRIAIARQLKHERLVGRDEGFVGAADICRRAARAYDEGAGSDHSPKAREVGRAQAIWCAEEIARSHRPLRSPLQTEIERLRTELRIRAEWFEQSGYPGMAQATLAAIGEKP
jgi:hypothetical protein